MLNNLYLNYVQILCISLYNCWKSRERIKCGSTVNFMSYASFKIKTLYQYTKVFTFLYYNFYICIIKIHIVFISTFYMYLSRYIYASLLCVGSPSNDIIAFRICSLVQNAVTTIIPGTAWNGILKVIIYSIQESQ